MTENVTQTSERLVAKYGMHVSNETAVSIFTNHTKVPVLLSRASFRHDVRTEQRTKFQRDRRNFLHGMIGFAAFSISALLLLKIASSSTSQLQTSTSAVNTAVAFSGRLLANATNVPPNQSLTLNDSTFGPILLIHLDNGQFVAYSPICTHAGCQVQFDPSAKDIVCPCHGAVYDPYHSAQVLGGPAPSPLQMIPIQYDSSTGNIYVTG